MCLLCRNLDGPAIVVSWHIALTTHHHPLWVAQHHIISTAAAAAARIYLALAYAYIIRRVLFSQDKAVVSSRRFIDWLSMR